MPSPYLFSRKGDCAKCGGSGTIYKYRQTKDGRCFDCGGTGGTRPPKDVYKVLYLDHQEGSARATEVFIGLVQRSVGGWLTSRLSDKTFPTRLAAAEALLAHERGS